jgi:cytochrome c-type biogenesis protein CcmH/NrfG
MLTQRKKSEVLTNIIQTITEKDRLAAIPLHPKGWSFLAEIYMKYFVVWNKNCI